MYLRHRAVSAALCFAAAYSFAQPGSALPQHEDVPSVQPCTVHPKNGIQEESSAVTAYKSLLADAPGCAAAGQKGCSSTKSDAADLEKASLETAARLAGCAAQASDDVDGSWYEQRSQFWLDLRQEMEANATAVGNGTYVPSTGMKAAFAGNTATKQCNTDPGNTPFRDCDWNFSIIGGVEQSGLASQASQTDGFLRVFTRAGNNNFFDPWAAIRLLGAPSQSSSNGVIAAFTNPTGTITTQSLTSVGYAIDYSLGFETLPWYGHKAPQYTASLIGEFGGTTPFVSNTLSAAYKAPAFGTVECGELYRRFQTVFAADNIVPGTASNTTGTTPACLVNASSATTSGTSAVTTYTPINTIGFSNQDRSSFLGKWFIGVRTIDRFLAKGAKACGDSDPVNKIAPCGRGVVDALFGADASVNKGLFRPWVFKVDAVHPLLIKDTSYLYLFGSFTARMKKNVNQAPLILQSGDVTALTGTGSSAVPNVNTIVLPLTQPDRDFYRFGLGLDVSCVFTKVFGNSSACSGFSGSGQ